ncbi:MAG: hypothetical protein PW788_13170 [Micavibrio sp.]|nr:hypothetical protein [Micavibrio sp.]
MTVKKHLAAAALALVLSAATTGAMAESMDVKPLGAFGKWEAAYWMENGKKVCYMATRPTATDSKSPVKGRDPAYLFITHWPGDSEKNAVTITAGFDYKPGTKAVVAIGGKVFNMATGSKATAKKGGAGTDAQMAWMDDQVREDELTDFIQKETGLTVKSTSRRGNVITDSYSLDGSSEAYKAISRECGY